MDHAVSEHYDAVADKYGEQYNPEHIHDASKPYPANYLRLQLLLNSFVSRGHHRVIEVGVGEGTPLITLAQSGMDVWGFDISHEMLRECRANLARHGMRTDNVFWGDILYPSTYIPNLPADQFDGLVAMGVMPHVENDDMVLDNMAAMVRHGGSVFIEFRNKLFSLFTFNRYTYSFIMDDLLRNVSDKVKLEVTRDIEKRLCLDRPPVRDYDSILSKFHNPFEVKELFQRHGFREIQYKFYHYHPAMPYLEEKLPDLFREEAITLEQEYSGWRGYFLCSSFVVEAVRERT